MNKKEILKWIDEQISETKEWSEKAYGPTRIDFSQPMSIAAFGRVSTLEQLRAEILGEEWTGA